MYAENVNWLNGDLVVRNMMSDSEDNDYSNLGIYLLRCIDYKACRLNTKNQDFQLVTDLSVSRYMVQEPPIEESQLQITCLDKSSAPEIV